jgi:hypothetical protein
MQVEGGADPFNRQDLAVFIDVADLLRTGTYQLSIQNNGTGATDALVAAYFSSGQSNSPDNFGQGILFRIADKDSVCSIDVEPHFS